MQPVPSPRAEQEGFNQFFSNVLGKPPEEVLEEEKRLTSGLQEVSQGHAGQYILVKDSTKLTRQLKRISLSTVFVKAEVTVWLPSLPGVAVPLSRCSPDIFQTIKSLEAVATSSNVFYAENAAILPLWLGMIVWPEKPLTKAVMSGYITVIVAALLYVWLTYEALQVYATWTSHLGRS